MHSDLGGLEDGVCLTRFRDETMGILGNGV